MQRFDGINGIVTGAGGGIGRAVALRLAQEGAGVLAVDIRGEKADETAAMAAVFSGRVVPFKADVTSAGEVSGYVDAAWEAFGSIRFFHNNAGIGGVHKSIEDTGVAEWGASMDVMLNACFYGLKYVLPRMKESGGGSVVNMGSILALKGEKNRSDYVTAKHAIIGLTRTAAIEVARDGIKVNAICPGPILTELVAEHERIANPADPMGERRRYEEGTPVGRYGTLEEAAELISFLLAPGLYYLTGATISFDGGLIVQ